MLPSTFRQSQVWQYFHSYWHIQFSLESCIPLDEDLLYGGKKTAVRNSDRYQCVPVPSEHIFFTAGLAVIRQRLSQLVFLNNNM